LNIDIGPGIVALYFQANQAVVHPDTEDDEEHKYGKDNPTKHRQTSFGRIEHLENTFTIRA
jgi:hypothetical protein